MGRFPHRLWAWFDLGGAEVLGTRYLSLIETDLAHTLAAVEASPELGRLFVGRAAPPAEPIDPALRATWLRIGFVPPSELPAPWPSLAEADEPDDALVAKVPEALAVLAAQLRDYLGPSELDPEAFAAMADARPYQDPWAPIVPGARPLGRYLDGATPDDPVFGVELGLIALDNLRRALRDGDTLSLDGLPQRRWSEDERPSLAKMGSKLRSSVLCAPLAGLLRDFALAEQAWDRGALRILLPLVRRELEAHRRGLEDWLERAESRRPATIAQARLNLARECSAGGRREATEDSNSTKPLS